MGLIFFFFSRLYCFKVATFSSIAHRACACALRLSPWVASDLAGPRSWAALPRGGERRAPGWAGKQRQSLTGLQGAGGSVQDQHPVGRAPQPPRGVCPLRAIPARAFLGDKHNITVFTLFTALNATHPSRLFPALLCVVTGVGARARTCFLTWVKTHIATVPGCQASRYFGSLSGTPLLLSWHSLASGSWGPEQECEWRRRGQRRGEGRMGLRWKGAGEELIADPPVLSAGDRTVLGWRVLRDRAGAETLVSTMHAGPWRRTGPRVLGRQVLGRWAGRARPGPEPAHHTHSLTAQSHLAAGAPRLPFLGLRSCVCQYILLSIPRGALGKPVDKTKCQTLDVVSFSFSLSDCFNCSVVVLMDLRPWSGSCLSDFQLLFVNNLKRKKKETLHFGDKPV